MRRLATALLLVAPFAVSAQFAERCGSLTNHYGPYDYTDPANRVGEGDKNRLGIVERFHFTPDIENLSRRDHTGEIFVSSLLGDLDYTLRAFPNHHRALYAVSKLELSLDGPFPHNPSWDYTRSSLCYFERALRFRPNDPIVLLLKGIFLHRKDRLEEALEAYLAAEALYPKIPDLQYNLGLLYHDMGEYEKAKSYAQQAYQLGHRQQGLRNKLAEAGYWP